MTVIPVQADSPSATTEPMAQAVAGSALVVWRPERGWLCSQRLPQPCPHTAGLAVGRSSRWQQ